RREFGRYIEAYLGVVAVSTGMQRNVEVGEGVLQFDLPQPRRFVARTRGRFPKRFRDPVDSILIHSRVRADPDEGPDGDDVFFIGEASLIEADVDLAFGAPGTRDECLDALALQFCLAQSDESQAA